MIRKIKYQYEEDMTDPDRDLPKDRQIKLKNNILHIRQEGMYGHWFINFDKGQIPDSLKGAYTTPEYAQKEALAYLSSKGRLEDIVSS